MLTCTTDKCVQYNNIHSHTSQYTHGEWSGEDWPIPGVTSKHSYRSCTQVAYMYTKSTNNENGQATTDNMYCTCTKTTHSPSVLIVGTQSNTSLHYSRRTHIYSNKDVHKSTRVHRQVYTMTTYTQQVYKYVHIDSNSVHILNTESHQQCVQVKTYTT